MGCWLVLRGPLGAHCTCLVLAHLGFLEVPATTQLSIISATRVGFLKCRCSKPSSDFLVLPDIVQGRS